MKERYNNLDGLRAYAAIGIVMMHVLENGNYAVSGFWSTRLIPSFTNFTFLFMIISAFSMCCGYYDRLKNGTIDLEAFYKRRYQKIWPYFAALCTLALLMSFSEKSFYEYLADLTLAFGLIPDNRIEILGVGWFIGIVFLFYMLFPFFVFLMSNKRRAWFTFVICLMLNMLTLVRFTSAEGRDNFIYSAVFFVAGGLIYLYREKLRNKVAATISGMLTVLLIIIFYSFHGQLFGEYLSLMIFSSMLIFAVSVTTVRGLSNKVLAFISGISMEIYLSHMVIYRLLEKMHGTKLLGGARRHTFLGRFLSLQEQYFLPYCLGKF